MTLFLLMGASWAATLQVGPTRAHTTIQSAVDAASSGDRVEIDPGTYAEDVDLGGLDLELVGAGSASTAIHCTGTCVDARGSGEVLLQDLALRQGDRGVHADGELSLVDVLVEGLGDGTAPGAAVRMDGGLLSWAGGGAEYCDSTSGAIYLDSAEATNLIVAHNDGLGFYAAGEDEVDRSEVRYSDVWDNAEGDWGGAFSDLTGTAGNISADPLFVSWSDDSTANDDLHLTASSPCLDTGHPSRTDADGSRSDMGAYGGEYAEEIDYDGDGVLPSEGDCDDTDATAWPGAEEIPYDGVDNDCAGDGDLTDVDGDGFDAEVVGGEDCDDTDPEVHPGAEEIWYDGIDQDCDGQSDYDQDGDGHDAAEYGGDDPDDTDPFVVPEEDDPEDPDNDEEIGCAGCQGKGWGGTFTGLLLLLPVARRRRST